MRLRPREWVWGAAALACAAVFVRLGIWQVRRLEERRGRNAGSAARRALPPILLGRGSVITLDSVQNQTLSHLEIIVVDDASSDRTVEIVAARAAQDSRIRLIRLAANVGPAKARNAS